MGSTQYGSSGVYNVTPPVLTDGQGTALATDRNGVLKVSPYGGSLVTAAFDSISATYPSATVEVYAYSLGGVTKQTVTVTYTDSTKSYVSSVARS